MRSPEEVRKYHRERRAAERKDPNKGERIRANARAYYHRHNEVNRAKAVERRLLLKTKVLAQYSKGSPECACCGEKEILFLSIDHINNDGAEHRRQTGLKGGADMYNWLKKNNYPEGYRVLCMNCQFGYRQGVCPHAKSRLDAE